MTNLHPLRRLRALRGPASATSVETPNGVTRLSGFARNRVEKERAGTIARDAKGIRAVRNDIIVRR